MAACSLHLLNFSPVNPFLPPQIAALTSLTQAAAAVAREVPQEGGLAHLHPQEEEGYYQTQEARPSSGSMPTEPAGTGVGAGGISSPTAASFPLPEVDDPDLLPVPPDDLLEDDDGGGGGGDYNRGDYGWSCLGGMDNEEEDDEAGVPVGFSQTDPDALPEGPRDAPAAEFAADGGQAPLGSLEPPGSTPIDLTGDDWVTAVQETGPDAMDEAEDDEAAVDEKAADDGDGDDEDGGGGGASSSAPSKGVVGASMMTRSRAVVDAYDTMLPNSVIRSYIADRSTLIRPRDSGLGAPLSAALTRAGSRTAKTTAASPSVAAKRRRRYLLDVSPEEVISAVSSGQLLPGLNSSDGHMSTAALSRSLHLVSLMPRGCHAALVSLHAFVLRGGSPQQAEAPKPEAAQQETTLASGEAVAQVVAREAHQAEEDLSEGGGGATRSAAGSEGVAPNNAAPGGDFPVPAGERGRLQDLPGRADEGARADDPLEEDPEAAGHDDVHAAVSAPQNDTAAAPVTHDAVASPMELEDNDPYQQEGVYLDVFQESRRDGDEDEDLLDGEPAAATDGNAGAEVGFTQRTKGLIRQLEKIFRKAAAAGGESVRRVQKKPRLDPLSAEGDQTPAQDVGGADDVDGLVVGEEGSDDGSPPTQVSLLTQLLPKAESQRERRSHSAKAAAQQQARRLAAQTFYDLLVLQNRGYVRLEQEGGYADVGILPCAPLLMSSSSRGGSA